MFEILKQFFAKIKDNSVDYIVSCDEVLPAFI